MNLKLGEKIKQLRLRDGRRQEDLATALCVSPQAISRWEANGGYPDMELIPAIANYFHVSIDELFGYNNDREKKINSILEKADEMIKAERPLLGRDFPTENLEKCVELLRDAAAEFPNEPRILIRLGKSLHMLGWNKKGAKVNYDDKLGVHVEDVAYNTDNVYWHEALQVYEKVLMCGMEDVQRDEAIIAITVLNRVMGNYDKGKAVANKQNSLGACKERLLASATSGEEGAMYRGKEIIALLHALQTAIISASALAKAFQTENGRQVLLDLLKLQETVYGEGEYGRTHLDIGFGWMVLAEHESKCGEIQIALKYFDQGFEHYLAYNNCLGEKEYSYNSPLLLWVKETIGEEAACVDRLYFEKIMSSWPDTFCTELRKNPKYAICFE
jgi:transcriptional regulator with XRE-family HTH domain